MFIITIKFICISFLYILFQDLMAQGEPIIFSATGDVPYGSSEIPIFQQQIVDHNLYSPSEFFVHLGDIKNQADPCDESFYSNVANDMMELAVPVFIVPGDNETTDCMDESQAWDYWVQYFMDFELNFCNAPVAERQAIRPENFAFIHKGVLFIGINLVSGISNPIMIDDADWVEQQFQDNVSQVRGAVILSQCGRSSSLRRAAFFDRFEVAAQTFAKPILFIHGDGHSWIMDNPFTASNVLRVQVNDGGSEEPVQVTVTMDSQNMFQFLRNPFSNNPQIYNSMPCVRAGPDQQTTLASSINLQGISTDDGVPLSPGILLTTWTKISGPGTVTFDNPNNLVTTASFSHPGIYLLRLTADDGELQNYDEMTVEVTDVLVEVKIFLEGPYDASRNSMRTDLKDNDILLTTAPYSEDPRMVSSIPENITDWVLVELRETATGPAVASRSAFLRNDGYIVADDGITPTIVMAVETNFYYIVIKHRNHLSVMSANSVQLRNNSSTLFDFSIGTSQYYGSDAILLETGVYGLYRGDANASAFINATDYLFVKDRIGFNGYYLEDCNLNGFVNATDYLFIKTNIGKSSYVP